MLHHGVAQRQADPHDDLLKTIITMSQYEYLYPSSNSKGSNGVTEVQ